MNKFVHRFTNTAPSSTASSSTFQTEEYGYALPLGRGIEKMPMPEFDMPTVLDVSTILCSCARTDEGNPTPPLTATLSQPSSFLQLHTDDASDPSCRIKINHGTTTLAFRFKGGIIVAVDSRATAGSYIGALRVDDALIVWS